MINDSVESILRASAVVFFHVDHVVHVAQSRSEVVDARDERVWRVETAPRLFKSKYLFRNNRIIFFFFFFFLRDILDQRELKSPLSFCK